MKAGTPEGEVNFSLVRHEWDQRQTNSQRFKLLKRDEAVFLKQSLSTPCLDVIEHAEGSEIVDANGKRFLDFHGNSVHQVGYAHPEVMDAIEEALRTLPFCPRRFTNRYAIQLAERLQAVGPIPGAKMLFAPGGAEAMGIALKIARIATGRHKTLGMWGSFHGASLDMASVGGESLFRSGVGPLLSGTEHVSPPDPTRCPLGCCGSCDLRCAGYLEYVLEQEGDVCAVVAEPIRATTVALPPPDYWPRVRAACDRHGAMLIFDEIPTCLGRTGPLFATELTGITPDIVVIGKGLGGAVFPMAAALARPELDVAADKALGHYTHEKSPVGSAVGLAVLDVLQGGVLESAAEVGALFRSLLDELAKEFSAVQEVRSVGMLFGIECSEPEIAERVLYESLDRGLSFKVSSGTVLTLAPPLILTKDQAKRAVAILRESFTHC